jgi:hypothetical protein
MSGRELQRIEVLSEVLARRRTETRPRGFWGRQTRRLLIAHRDGGGGALIHKARGRTSNNRLIAGIREYVIELVRSRYADFGPSLAAEVLFEKDGVKISERRCAGGWSRMGCGGRASSEEAFIGRACGVKPTAS